MADDDQPRIFGVPIPSEIVSEMERHVDLHRMTAETMKHDVYNFIDNLPREDFAIFQLIIHTLADEEEDGSYAKFLSGYLLATRKARFGICPGCGQDHDKQVEEVLGNHDSTVPTEPYILSEEDFADMEKYNLDDLRDEDTHDLLGFICKNCGMRYVSIADRKLRPPGVDGCNGCQLRSAHG